MHDKLTAFIRQVAVVIISHSAWSVYTMLERAILISISYIFQRLFTDFVIGKLPSIFCSLKNSLMSSLVKFEILFWFFNSHFFFLHILDQIRLVINQGGRSWVLRDTQGCIVDTLSKLSLIGWRLRKPLHSIFLYLVTFSLLDWLSQGKVVTWVFNR